ncbi:MAG TPA: hypothetical protein VMU07_02625, partial [Candidatus Paceibacterota bacterium]|nr:hypothetical protein [Candidatus Paceibacterota bacterium]
ALRGILGVIAKEKEPAFVVKWITEVLPTYLKHDDEEDAPCLICQSQDILAEAMAAAGDVEGAREVAKKQRIPADQVATWLGVYKTSRALEDLEAARTIAEKYDYELHEQWLKIAEATHEMQDIARARAEVLKIPNPIRENETGWVKDFRINDNLLAIAKITNGLTPIY